MSLFERAHPDDPHAPLRRSVALVAGLALALVALAAMRPGLPLGADLPRPGHWTTWLAHVGPAVALMATIRLVGLVVGGYLLAVAALDLAANLTRSAALATIARRVTVPTARRLIAGVTGAGLAMSITVAAVAPGLASASPRPTTTVTSPTRPAGGACPDPLGQTNPAYASGRPSDHDCPNITMRQTNPAYASGVDDRTAPEDPAAAPAGPPTDPAATTDPPTMRRLDPEPTTSVPAAPAPDPTAGPTTGPPAPAADPAPAAPSTSSWTIAPGDHLWRVAERTLQAAWGRRPRVAETATYLDALIQANHDVLVVRDEPDLVFPGQVFTLPVVPAA